VTSDASAYAAIILAAGASSRMGRPKALVEWGGGTFLSSLLDVYSPLCGCVRVVVGFHQEQVRARQVLPPNARFVMNPAPECGQLSSLQTGLADLPLEARWIWFQPVDAPGISSATLQALAGAIGSSPVAVPVFRGRHGHPVLIARPVAAEILRLPSSGMARDVLRAHRLSTVWVEVDDPAVLRDFDDESALRSARP
jgi:molybdenum cofactor cytidylyltransferase